ncbi:MAG: KH domain-containing protein [Sulfolobaceae archaeon]|nr:KH domain-containing protein [Sulfolobaceae archaeon]
MSYLYVTVEDEKLKIIKDIAQKLGEMSDTVIEIDEKVKSIRVNPKSGNIYEAMKALNVIKAIGYGFNVDDALKLLSDDYRLEVIDIKDYSRNPQAIRRVLGRIIGEGGKTKKIIQEYTGVIISVHDHYVSILGVYDQVEIAKKAIMMLIEGREHSTVYKYLDKAEADLRLYRAEQLSKERLKNK